MNVNQTDLSKMVIYYVSFTIRFYWFSFKLANLQTIIDYETFDDRDL